MPTDKAYRYYVDSLMGRAEVGRADAHRLQRQVSGTRSEIDDLMEATSAQLSELSHYAAVILAPPLQHTRLERVDLIPVEGDRAIVVLATETGWGMSRILAFEEPVPRSEVREVARLLTEQYAGLTFQEIRSRVAERARAGDARARAAASAAYGGAQRVPVPLGPEPLRRRRDEHAGPARVRHRHDAGPPQDVRGEAPADRAALSRARRPRATSRS